ncbi:MAG: transcription termination factor NusA [Planctomycetota bacterium]
MNEELLRHVDSIHRDKGVDKDTIYAAIEEALAAAARKRYKTEEELEVKIDRTTGEISAIQDGEVLPLDGFGRIAARTAYQVMNQRIREAERDVIYDDFEAKIDTLVTGTVQRFERGSIVVNLGRTEGILPRQEQVFNETYRAGDRIRAYVLAVKKKGQKVVIVLSRTHPNLVKELFALEIPEVSDRIVEIKNIVREPGFRTKVAVASNDMRVDPQGACIGVRGTRIRNIVEELSGERIDIIPWNESGEIFIKKSLSPAEITAIELDRDSQRARAIVPEDQLSLAIGKRGQNVRLAARLTGWHLDILTEEEAKREKEMMRAEMQRLPEVIEGLDASTIETMTLSGFSSLHAIAKKGVEALQSVKGIDEIKAHELHTYALGRVKEIDEEKMRRIEEERRRAREEAAAALAAEEAAAAAAAEEAKAAEAKAEEAGEAEAPSAESTGEDAQAEEAEATEDSSEVPAGEDTQAEEAGGAEEAEAPESVSPEEPRAEEAQETGAEEAEAGEATADQGEQGEETDAPEGAEAASAESEDQEQQVEETDAPEAAEAASAESEDQEQQVEETDAPEAAEAPSAESGDAEEAGG